MPFPFKAPAGDYTVDGMKLGAASVTATEQYFARTVLLVALAVLALPPLRETLRMREEALSLYSWLLLRSVEDKVAWCVSMNEPHIFDAKAEWHDIDAQKCHEQAVTMKARVPGTRDLHITKLTKVYFDGSAGVALFVPSIGEEDDLKAPMEKYAFRVSGVAGKIGYTASVLDAKEFSYEALGMLVTSDTPWGWDSSRYGLVKRGWSGEDPDHLALEDRALQTYLGDAISQGYTFLGIELNGGMTYASVGIIFLVLAFIALGPVVSLHRTRGMLPAASYTVVLTGIGIPGALFEALLVAITTLWVAAPVALLMAQLRMQVWLIGWEPLLFRASVFGFVIASVVQGWVAWEWHVLRQPAMLARYRRIPSGVRRLGSRLLRRRHRATFSS